MSGLRCDLDEDLTDGINEARAPSAKTQACACAQTLAPVCPHSDDTDTAAPPAVSPPHNQRPKRPSACQTRITKATTSRISAAHANGPNIPGDTSRAPIAMTKIATADSANPPANPQDSTARSALRSSIPITPSPSS